MDNNQTGIVRIYKPHSYYYKPAISYGDPIYFYHHKFFKSGYWLKDAVESVLAQSYQHWELLLVDDGSKSPDSQIALNFVSHYPDKIIYVDHKDHCNIGLTASRNKGISLARGTLIAFLDADDCWCKDKLTNQLNIFRNNTEAVMICEASRFWYSWADTEAHDPVIVIGAPERLYQPGELTKLLYPLGPGQPPCPSGIVVKKEAINRSGMFDESFSGVYQLYEDQAFLAKMYLNEKVYISADCNNIYRKHSNSMSGAANNPVIYKKVRCFFLDWLNKYIDENRIDDVEVLKMIRAAAETNY